MPIRPLLCLALILSGVPFNCTRSLAGQTFTSGHYGFQLEVPDGWKARETYFSFAHYSDVFLTINNQRPNLQIVDWPTGTNVMEFGPNTTFDQLRPGEVYVAVGYSSGPGGDSMRNDTVGDDLTSLLATKRISPSRQPGLSELNLGFIKRGHSWFVSVSMRAPVTEENCDRVMTMLKSFRFLDSPVANIDWAESLAWRELPQQIQSPAEIFMGWPTVGGGGAGSQARGYGPRAVTIERTDAEYKAKFTLMGIGTWGYSVSTNGTVHAEPPVFDAINVPASRWPSDLPGEVKGKMDAVWVAPYVQEMSQFGKKTLIWFSKDGRIERQTSVDSLQPGFAGISGRPNMIQGINGDWQITLPREPKPLLAGYITSTADSRVFVHERHPKFGLIAVDIYIHGKRVNTVGPFPQYSANDVVLNEDGSAALLVTETNMAHATPLRGDALRDAFAAAEQVHAQVITLNTNGRVQFKTDCGPSVWSPIVAPHGVGVLLRPNTGRDPNRFMWFTATGPQRSLDISPNPECLDWIPGTCQSLFSAGLAGQSGPYRLIDWNTGETLWTNSWPGKGEVMGIGFTPEFIFFSVVEPYPSSEWNKVNDSLPGSGEKWVQAFYAVNVQDSKVAARWQGQFPHRWYNPNRDYFLRLGNRLYYVTTDEFTEINTEDVREKRNGWE